MAVIARELEEAVRRLLDATVNEAMDNPAWATRAQHLATRLRQAGDHMRSAKLLQLIAAIQTAK